MRHISLIPPTQPTTCTPVLTVGLRWKRLQKKPCGNPFSEMYVLLLTGGEEPRVPNSENKFSWCKRNFEFLQILFPTSVLKTEAILFREVAKAHNTQ